MRLTGPRGSEVELHREPVRLDLVAASAAERTRRHASQVTIREHLSPCTVPGDADLLERAIGNLLDNAAKWSPPGGHIDLTVSNGDVMVADEGPGIEAADLPFIFDRFYRSPAARGLPGSGLGLAIVRQVAERHGGRAEAASSEHGAILRLRLPGPDGRSEPAPAGSRDGTPRTGPGPGRLTWRAARSSRPAGP